jgi:flagellar basal body-associated protein FliL
MEKESGNFMRIAVVGVLLVMVFGAFALFLSRDNTKHDAIKENVIKNETISQSMYCAKYVFTKFNLTDNMTETDQLIELVDRASNNQSANETELNNTNPLVRDAYITFMTCALMKVQ